MDFLTRFSLRKAPIIFMLMALVAFGGWTATQQLRSELLPNIDLPVLSVVTVYPGAAPDDVRRDVTEPIEKILAGSANLKSVSSTSSDSVSFVTAQYEYGTNMEKTQQTIQDSLNRLTLPAQVQRPTAGRFNFQDIPVVAYTINTDDTSEDALANLRRDVEDKVAPDLKAINGVNSVVISGGGEKQVVITFDAEKLREKGLTTSQVTGVLQANNISFPTGQIVDNAQSIPVRVSHQFNSVGDLRDLVVRPEVVPSGGGAGAGAGAGGGAQGGQQGAGSGQAAPAEPTPAVKLSDVASVELANISGETISRSNGKPSLSLIVYKTQNANTIQVADNVNAAMDQAIKGLPGSEKNILVDQSVFIKESLDGLIREGLLGALLAIVVILVFLTNIRSTLITAVSIPLSVLIALILLNVFGISLNIMSLAGLAVAIGRVVDDSIVVLENIYRHHFQEGESLRDAAYNGTKEVATAITSSTITTVCVFLPLGFIAGLVSEFFRPFAVAVTVSLLASLVVALTAIPVLAVILLKSRRARPVAHAERDTWVQRLYTPTIRFALRNGWTKAGVIVAALLLFAGSMALVPFIGTSFINVGSDKVLNVDVNLAPGTDIQTTSDVAANIEAELQKRPQVENYQVNIGSNTEAASSGFASLGNSSTAEFTINYDREVDIRAEAEQVRTLLGSLSSANNIDLYNVTPGVGGGFNSSAFAAVVSGSDYDQVLKASDSLVNRLETIPDLVNVTSDAARAKSEIQVQVDPEAALAHGTTAAQIAQQVRNLLTSQSVTNITIDGRLYEVQATYDQATLDDIEAIKDITVGTVNPVPLSEVAQVSIGEGPVSITRVDEERAVTVRGTINSESTSGVTGEAQKAIDAVKAEFGGDLRITLGGVSQQQSESFGQMTTALVIAVLLVYMVMVLTFGSLSTPFIIMFSLPLAAIGSIVALFVTGRPLGISALIGVLMLVGIVVTNAIVLLDLVEQLKHRGVPTREALVQGGRTRVRPIIMTAVATMIALMPLVLGFSEGSIIAAELGTVVVGGLFTSTLLTLIVVPVAYSLLDSLRSRFGRSSRELEATRPVPPVAGVSTNGSRKSPFLKPTASRES